MRTELLPTGRKPTRSEVAERTEVAAFLLGSMAHKYLVKQDLKKRYDISSSTAENYLKRARLLIRERTALPRFEHRMEAEAFYRSELQRSSEPMVRIACRQRLDWIHGVDAKFGPGPAEPEEEEQVTANVANLSVDEIDQQVDAGADIDPSSLAHLSRGDRLRILRKLAGR